MAVVSPTGLLPIVLDPGSPDELNLNDGVGYVVGADLSLEPPAVKPVYASSVDTEGSIPVENSAHYENREIGFKVRVYGDADEEIEERIARLAQRIGQIHRAGGVIGITTPGGRTCFFDLVNEGSASPEFGVPWLKLNKTDVEVRLQARPFWRGAEVELGTFTETSDPALVFTVHGIEGDVPALGRLVVRELAGANQWVVIVGVEGRYYNSDPEAGLYFQGDQLTPLGTSIAPGLGLVTNTNLVGTYQEILSSRYGLSGSHLKHKGPFHVLARLFRPTSNTGQVSVRLRYGQAMSGKRALSEPVTFSVGDREGTTTLADLGVVRADPDWSFWEFRVLAKSTADGDEISVADLMLVPTDQGYIRMSAINLFDDPVAKNGNAAVSSVGVGSVGWFNPAAALAPGGSAASSTLAATETSNYLGVTGFGFSVPSTATIRGIGVDVARSTADADDFPVGIAGAARDARVRLVKASAIQTPDKADTATTWPDFPPHVYRTYGGADDLWSGSWTPADVNASDFGVAIAATVPSGGQTSIASVDHIRITIYYTEFLDAAIYANRALELTHNGARREALDDIWADVAVPAGRYLRLSPGTNRLIVKPVRRDPAVFENTETDDVEADLFATPRGLVVPGA